MVYEIPEAVQQWLAALRSGTYKQGKGGLRPTPDSFCCLGVACNIIDPDGWEYNSDDNAEEVEAAYYWNNAGQVMHTPAWVTFIGPIHTMLSQGGLAALNDSGRYSFAKIADYIEAFYKGENV